MQQQVPEPEPEELACTDVAGGMMHDNIERAFESIITDAARELFQEITDEHSA